MDKRLVGLGVFIIVFGLGLQGLGADKVRFGTAVKAHPIYALPPIAAEEKGFWRAQGLEVQWMPFNSGGAMYRAVAAGSVETGITGIGTHIIGASGGVPAILVADLKVKYPFGIWVLTASRLKEPRELKGAKIGLVALGGDAHAYGQAIVKALGLQKEVKFVAFGGVRQYLASLRVGGIEAVVSTIYALAPLYLKGEVRQVAAAEDYLPKEWMDPSLFGRKDFIAERPEQVKKIIKAVFQTTDFIMKNRDWSVRRMKTEFNYTDEMADFMYGFLLYGKEGKINRKAVENAVEFLTQYGVISKERVLAVDKLFTNEFVQ